MQPCILVISTPHSVIVVMKPDLSSDPRGSTGGSHYTSLRMDFVQVKLAGWQDKHSYAMEIITGVLQEIFLLVGLRCA